MTTQSSTQIVKPAVIVADSLCQNLRYLKKADVYSFSGCRIKNLIHKIKFNMIDISNYKVVLINIGTNDLITDKSIWFAYSTQVKKNVPIEDIVLPPHQPSKINIVVSHYKELLDVVRDKNTKAKIIVTGILPRPYDFSVNRQYLMNINAALEDMVSSYRNSYFHRTQCCFIKSKVPKPECFLFDGLHLSPAGTKLLRDIFSCEISKALK